MLAQQVLKTNREVQQALRHGRNRPMEARALEALQWALTQTQEVDALSPVAWDNLYRQWYAKHKNSPMIYQNPKDFRREFRRSFRSVVDPKQRMLKAAKKKKS